MRELSKSKIGARPVCAVCGKRKAPIGRSAPVELYDSYCHPAHPVEIFCPGYSQEPHAGSLWPGESEFDFGYPVSDHGTVL